MKISIASDHAGFELKNIISKYLKDLGYQINDLGTYSNEAVDYPDFAKKIAQSIIKKESDKGILICGSGIGACITANKFKGIRAGICHDTYSARQGVEHDKMNILCMGSRIIGVELAKEIVLAFIKAKFSNIERHKRRLNKIDQIELENFGGKYEF